MTSLENTRHSLIDRILATKNESFLKAITAIFDSSQTEEIVEMSPEQVKMIMMAKEDVAAGRIISDEDLKASDPEWLR
ncbi:hypothetical protein AAEO56_17000 [Flavobacterium sp. DGU11]|uniref:Uncharacterized protein n=1 Tax=Flavobacterium arundinis TaxID=3139143 RepID=A0ABU9I0L3_9FLAO